MVDPVRLQGEALKSTGARTMVGAAVLVVIGIAVTAITYNNAGGGDTYIFAWGPILIGGFTFFRGLVQYLRGASILRRAGGAFPAAPPTPAAGLPAAPPTPAAGLPAAPPPATWLPAAPPAVWTPLSAEEAQAQRAPQPQWAPPPPPAGPPPAWGPPAPPPPPQPPERAV